MAAGMQSNMRPLCHVVILSLAALMVISSDAQEGASSAASAAGEEDVDSIAGLEGAAPVRSLSDTEVRPEAPPAVATETQQAPPVPATQNQQAPSVPAAATQSKQTRRALSAVSAPAVPVEKILSAVEVGKEVEVDHSLIESAETLAKREAKDMIQDAIAKNDAKAFRSALRVGKEAAVAQSELDALELTFKSSLVTAVKEAAATASSNKDRSVLLNLGQSIRNAKVMNVDGTDIESAASLLTTYAQDRLSLGDYDGVESAVSGMSAAGIPVSPELNKVASSVNELKRVAGSGRLPGQLKALKRAKEAGLPASLTMPLEAEAKQLSITEVQKLVDGKAQIVELLAALKRASEAGASASDLESLTLEVRERALLSVKTAAAEGKNPKAITQGLQLARDAGVPETELTSLRSSVESSASSGLSAALLTMSGSSVSANVLMEVADQIKKAERLQVPSSEILTAQQRLQQYTENAITLGDFVAAENGARAMERAGMTVPEQLSNIRVAAAHLHVDGKESLDRLFQKLASAKEANLPAASVDALAIKVKEKTETQLQKMMAAGELHTVIEALKKSKNAGLTSTTLDTIQANVHASSLNNVRDVLAAANTPHKAIRNAFELATRAGVSEVELAPFRTELQGKLKAQIQTATTEASSSSASEEALLELAKAIVRGEYLGADAADLTAAKDRLKSNLASAVTDNNAERVNIAVAALDMARMGDEVQSQHRQWANAERSIRRKMEKGSGEALLSALRIAEGAGLPNSEILNIKGKAKEKATVELNEIVRPGSEL